MHFMNPPFLPSFLPCLLPLFSYTFPAVCTLEHLFLCFACSNILNFSVVMRLQMLPSCRLSADASQLSQFLFFSSPESKIFCSDCGIWKLVTHVTCVSLTMTFVKIKSLTRHRPLKKEKKRRFFLSQTYSFQKKWTMMFAEVVFVPGLFGRMHLRQLSTNRS